MIRLGVDPVANRRELQDVLDGEPAGTLHLPPGRHRITGGLRVPAGWTVSGSDDTWLVAEGGDGHPVLHVVGSGVTIRDLGLRPAPADPGTHGGDRGTGLTVGDYLYRGAPEWISDVEVRRVRVEHGARRTANGVALMGAVRDVTLHDVTVHGGHTGLAVHWGAEGTDVTSITPPTRHPHRLAVTDLRVRDAVEGFYLSSVHDVLVSGACLRGVEMGFRLLPGDNTDRFGAHAEVGARITVRDVCVRWSGPRYAARVAGWGRSEVDGLVSVLPYRDTVIADCRLAGAGTAGTWSPVLLERAAGVELRDVRVTTGAHPACRLE